jgi:short-subunit dehydrogenase
MNVVITGASRGIGKAIAMAFAAGQHQLMLNARNEKLLHETAAAIRAVYPSTNIHAKAVDLSNVSNAAAFADFCLNFGTPDILVNNAGAYLPGQCIDEPEGALEEMMATNLYSAYHLTRKLVPAMMKQRRGHIFNICSVASLKAYPGGGGYSVSKFALDGFSQNLRQELMAYGIKVTAVYPGAVLTDSWGDFDNSNQRIMEAEDIAKAIVNATELSPQAVIEQIIIRPLLGDL